MLWSFTFENYKSFRDEYSVSMIASQKQELSERLIKYDSKKFLPTVSIYGPNASGKSSVVKALALFKNIVIEGGINKNLSKYTRNMEICPYFYDESYLKPIKFSIIFSEDDRKYKYTLHFIAHVVEENELPFKKIEFEELEIDDYKIFSRKENKIKLYNIRKKSDLDYTNISETKKDQDLINRIESNLNDTDLFLTGAFANIVSKEIANTVMDWFKNKLQIVLNFAKGHVQLYFDKIPKTKKKGELLHSDIFDKFSHITNIGTQDIRIKPKDKNEIEIDDMVSVYKVKAVNMVLEIAFKAIESEGTIKLAELIYPILDTIKKGKILIIDELDASLHPEMILGIFNLFNDPEINTNHAQMIITTHNLTLLSKHYLRRDQIYLIDRKENASEMYTLADFPNVRNDSDYLTNYVKGAYGAIPIVDFSSLFQSEKGSNDA